MSVTVKFENPGGNRMEIARPRFIIPAYGEKVVELPETIDSEKLIDRITSRNRAIKATLIDSEGEETPLQSVKELASQQEVTEVKTKSGFDAFKETVTKVEKGNAGWWSVFVEGNEEPYKVRVSKEAEEPEDMATELAYKESEAAE